MLATHALSEHSFSALHKLKTWLRTTTDQVRLNSCMKLHVHKNRTDSIPLVMSLSSITVAEYIFVDNKCYITHYNRGLLMFAKNHGVGFSPLAPTPTYLYPC